ncbi:hypothetical protein [Streptomyces albidoflavus]|nr:hypothetical protein [Streptomyces albidoflavus]
MTAEGFRHLLLSEGVTVPVAVGLDGPEQVVRAVLLQQGLRVGR